MNVISEIQRINQLELSKGLTHTPASWHSKYSSSAWINIGSLPLNLSEGDIICIFSQYGEIDDVHLVREADTGKSRGFAFLKYEDARSCVLAVDNLGGSCVLGRMLRVDHVERYRLPKHVLEREEKEAAEAAEEDDSDEKKIEAAEAGHAYKGQELASEYDIHAGQDLFAAPKKSDRHDDNNQREEASTTHDSSSMDINAMDSKAERKRRKEERAQKRKEKEEHRRRKEEQKRKKHSSRSSKDKKRRRSRSRS
ncbi:RNA-binding protein [Skeletonema marinoi]|uniref:RNA-binding protein n=1 Tax=Skeletonema marinoi TaxID=267567 RepID=A0AAD8Y976_9STRA|nr:RNA-binding protein [Skeletonema marinoi]